MNAPEAIWVSFTTDRTYGTATITAYFMDAVRYIRADVAESKIADLEKRSAALLEACEAAQQWICREDCFPDPDIHVATCAKLKAAIAAAREVKP